MQSLNGSLTVAKSPDGATELLESLFERNNNSQPAAKGRQTEEQTRGKILFNDI